MDPVTLAAVITAVAALIAALATPMKLWGPRRNGHKAVIRYLEDRLDATEASLEECLKRVRGE